MIYHGLQWRILCLAVCLLWVAQPGSISAQDDPLRHGHALIIGTWAYNDPRWQRLEDIDPQLRQVRIALAPHFDDIQVLANPTFDQLETGLRDFLRIRGNDEKARLFIYYAGHGYTELDLHRNEYRGYITGSDTPYVDGSSNSSLAAARLKAISMEELRGMVSDVSALQVLFVFDSCFAGTIFTARSSTSSPGRLTDDNIAKLMTLPVREFITAGDINERIPAHSPIPQLLVNALSGAADPYNLGVITGEQIQQYLWAQTRDLKISPRGGKLPGGYFDQGKFMFRTGLLQSPPPFAATAAPPTQSTTPSTQTGGVSLIRPGPSSLITPGNHSLISRPAGERSLLNAPSENQP